MMTFMLTHVSGYKKDILTTLHRKYIGIGFTPAAYDILVDWWVKETNNKPLHLYIGQAAYKINNNSVPAWSDPEEYPKQIALNRLYPDIKGSMHFSLKDINNNPLGVKDRLSKTYINILH